MDPSEPAPVADPVASPSATPAPAAPAAPATSRARSVWRTSVQTTAWLILITLALGASLVQALRTETGTRWVLRQCPGLSVIEARGALLGDFQADQVQLRWGPELTLQKLSWQGLEWRFWPASRVGLGLNVNSLQAHQVTWLPDPLSPPSAHAPVSLQWPLALHIHDLRVKALRILSPARMDAPSGTQAELVDIQAQVDLSRDAGASHGLVLKQLVWEGLQAQGEMQLQTQAPLNLSLNLEVTPQTARASETLPWQGELTLQGPLAEPVLKASLRGEPPTDRRPASRAAYARLVATLRPWAAWPLGELQGEASDIDLATLWPGAPHTALRAEAIAQTRSAQQPAELTLQVHNDDAGPWSDRRLPARSLNLQLQSRPSQLSVIDIPRLSIDWGSLQGSAGQIEGRGHVSHDSWALDLQSHDLQPAKLDERAAAMRLSGPLLVSGHGSHWETQADWKGVLMPPATPLAQGEISPALTATPTPVLLNVKVGKQVARPPLSAETWTLHTLQAQVGDAKLEASGVATHDRVGAPWQIQARSQLKQFDPLAWWPGPPGSVWREGGHRLHGEASLDIRTAAEGTPATPGHAWLQGWRGQIEARITDSRLANVPLSGEVSLKHAGGPSEMHLELQAAGNTLRLDGPWPGSAAPSTPTPSSAMQFEIHVPDLAPLSPWAALAQPRANMTRVSGRLQGHGQLSGAWPQLRTDGQLEVTDLRWGAHRLQSAQAQWELGTAANDPMVMHVLVKQASWQGHTVAQLDLQTQGRMDQHALSLQAQLEARPPAWLDELQRVSAPPLAPAPRNARLSTFQLNAQGALQTTPQSMPAGWRGQVNQWSVRGETAAGIPPWWEAEPVTVEATWGDLGSPQRPPARLSVSAGQGRLAGTALHWGPIQWQAGADGPAHLDADFHLDPVPIAPWLARWQPDFGWGGDLSVGLQAKVHTHPSMQAEVVIERHSGDLQVTDDSGTQALALSTLRLALNVNEGQWTFTQAIAGQHMGVISGAMVARTGPQQIWPTSDTPVQGVLALQVAQLGAWGNWLPAGWRLGGQLNVSAGVSGRWGAPDITGAIQGQDLSVRHLLEGVNISDGVVDIQLRGDTAHIERLSARSGNGSLQVQGEARLGDRPQAQLNILLDHFQLLGRVDRRLITSGQAQATLTREALTLEGQWVIDEGLIDFSRGDAPSLSDDVQVLRATTSSADPTPTAPPLTRPTGTAARLPVHLRLGVDLGQKLRLKGRGLNTTLRGALQVTSPDGVLRVNGNVTAEDGTYKAYGQQLNIDRGVVAFSGDVNNPRLDIEATRPNLEVRVGVLITGTAQSPRVRLFSEPDLSDIDKLSWLVLGRASDGLGSTDLTLLQRAAVALLAGEKEGVTDQFIRALGLDQLSVRQSDGAVKETIVSVGKQLSQRWYVGYERSLNATEGSWQLIYRIAQRFTLRAQTGYENAADLIWSWRWQ